MLKPIKPKRISDQVFEQLRDLIFRGHFKPGEQLMTEREMAGTLGVSRPTVREAINKLVSMGILVHRQGQGTFVASPGDDAKKNPLAAVIHDQDVSLQELLEVRLGLECNAVALAARRATEDDIQELRKSLDEMISEIEKGGLGHQADVSFHMAISYASKNTVQVLIMKNLYDLMFYGIKENLQHLYSEPGNLVKITQQHTDVFECIRRHDPEAAYEAMKRHITFVLDFFKQKSLA
jgi:GntR family transcriptional regulator, transcriptional repressor for pyruvate dehydrogenase complex